MQLRKTIGWQGILHEGFDDPWSDVVMAKLRKGYYLYDHHRLHHIMKTITCREAGFECDHVVKGETEEEVMRMVHTIMP